MSAVAPRPTTPVLLRDVVVGLGGRRGDVLLVDGKVADIGRPLELEAPSGAEVVPVPGAVLLPGLRDRHVHVVQWATALHRVDLTSTASAAEAVQAVAAFSRQAGVLPGGEVLVGYGFRDGLWPDTPHKGLLEAALPGRPVALVSNDLHVAWLSPAALAQLGLDHPSGVLREGEAFAAVNRLAVAPPDTVDQWVAHACAALPARGVTGILDFEAADTVTDWRRRRGGGPLPVRVECAIWPEYLDRALDEGLATGDRLIAEADDLLAGYAKVLLDGSLNTRTAYCHDPYPGVTDPGEGHGLLLVDSSELLPRMQRAAARGLYFAVHAIGDHANELALDCFEAAGCPGRIEHAQLVGPIDLKRFALPGLVAGVQPAHAAEDRDVAERHWAGRTDRAYPYAALLGAGAVLELGSDAPVSRADPWYVMAAAVARTVDDRPPWHVEQALTVEQALAASTGGRTSVAVGDVADLTLVPEDPRALPPSDLARMPVLATLLGGRFTHRSE